VLTIAAFCRIGRERVCYFEHLRLLSRADRSNGTDHPETDGTAFTLLGFTDIRGRSRNAVQWSRLPRSRRSGAVLGNVANFLRFIEVSRKADHANADPRCRSERNQHFPHRLSEVVRYDVRRLIGSGELASHLRPPGSFNRNSKLNVAPPGPQRASYVPGCGKFAPAQATADTAIKVFMTISLHH
jgi:hypothetical protein